jgi:deoxycytidylate deaminase
MTTVVNLGGYIIAIHSKSEDYGVKRKYFRKARAEALNSPSRFMIGAVLIRGHNIIGSGCNDQKKSHRDIKALAEDDYKEIVGIHAEFAACKGLRPYDIGDRADMYVYRIRRDTWGPGLARPCDICIQILQEKGIRRVFYTIGEDEYGQLYIR